MAYLLKALFNRTEFLCHHRIWRVPWSLYSRFWLIVRIFEALSPRNMLLLSLIRLWLNNFLVFALPQYRGIWSVNLIFPSWKLSYLFVKFKKSLKKKKKSFGHARGLFFFRAQRSEELSSISWNFCISPPAPLCSFTFVPQHVKQRGCSSCCLWPPLCPSSLSQDIPFSPPAPTCLQLGTQREQDSLRSLTPGTVLVSGFSETSALAQQLVDTEAIGRSSHTLNFRNHSLWHRRRKLSWRLSP